MNFLIEYIKSNFGILLIALVIIIQIILFSIVLFTKNCVKRGLFMKAIIIYCLAFIAVSNLWALSITEKTGEEPSSIVESINLVHGGELLLCCIKRLFTKSDEREKALTNNKEKVLTNNTNLKSENKES